VSVESKQAVPTNSPTNAFLVESNASQNASTKIIGTPTLTSTEPIAKNDRDRLPEITQKYNENHNIPIEFYGLVIDQYSNPVPNVKFNIAIQQTYMPLPTELAFSSKIIRSEKETGIDGHFEITGERGDAFDIESIHKDGYQLSAQTQMSYGYVNVSVPFHPDSRNPVVFKMWKLGEFQKLVSHRTLFGFQPDGRVYTLDLLNDIKTEGENSGGDLRIKFQRPPIKPNEMYSWTLEISAVDGGLVETTDEFTYLAPESGYQPQVNFETNSISPSAMPDLVKSYYFTSRNSQKYGVVHLQIYSDYRGQSAILVDSSVNPNGSRNLQP
jgi:hypothetical protein